KKRASTGPAATNAHGPLYISEGGWRVSAVISGKNEAPRRRKKAKTLRAGTESASSSGGVGSSSQEISSRTPRPRTAVRVRPGRRAGTSACVGRRDQRPQTTSPARH